MPAIDETHEITCSPTWKAVAGPGRIFIANRDTDASLQWALAGDNGPSVVSGYALPPSHGRRSDTEALTIPDGKHLWVRSTRPAIGRGAGPHPLLLTYEVAPDPTLATAPAVIAVWTLMDATTGGALDVAINVVPDDGGAAITGYEYRIGTGDWTPLGGTSGQITGLADNTPVSVTLRARNARGPGPVSASLTATPTTPATSGNGMGSGAGTGAGDDTAIFGFAYPASQPNSYGEELLSAAEATLDNADRYAEQGGDVAAFAVANGELVTDGSNTSLRWARQTGSVSPDSTPSAGEVYNVIAEVTESAGGSITPTGNAGVMSSGGRTGEVANYQASVEASGSNTFSAGLSISPGVVSRVVALRLNRIETLLERPQAIVLNVTQSNWVGHAAGYTRTKHPHVPGALYIPSMVNRGKGADTNGAGEPIPLMAMEPMQHQTLNEGSGPGGAFCAELRQHIPSDHTICYAATGFAGAGFKTGDRWNKDSANSDAYDGFWTAARQLWSRAQAWNPNSYIAGVNICIGESDLGGSLTAGNVSEHMAGLSAMIDELRSEPGWGEMPVVISEIGLELGVSASTDTNVTELNAAQQLLTTGSGDATFEKTRCVFVPRPAGSGFTDGTHYNEDSNIVRGRLAARAMANLIYPDRAPLSLDEAVA